ncbi:MAG TPA: hypothetical protein VK845_15505, partial [Gemmatimonadales bacterium]|nr:hypothetical protein [Gemmatimonadales bacterium]
QNRILVIAGDWPTLQEGWRVRHRGDITERVVQSKMAGKVPCVLFEIVIVHRMFRTNTIHGRSGVSKREALTQFVVVRDAIGNLMTIVSVQISEDATQARPKESLWSNVAQEVLQIIDRSVGYSAQVGHSDGTG